jgi:hypothetical protein
MAEYADYAWLVEDSAASRELQRLAGESQPELRQLELLRREFSPQRARLLVEQADLRRRAEVKFGDWAPGMFFTPVQLQQATDRWTAAYKARRFEKLRKTSLVHDFCCGIGGDLMALAAVRPACGWDVSPSTTLLAGANLQAVGRSATLRTDDVETAAPTPDEAWHVDPDRRAAGKRSTTIELHSPAPETIDRWRNDSPNGAVKLAPATRAPESWQREGELEWITCQRECRQQVAWFGDLADAPGKRRATQLHVRSAASDPVVAGSFVGQPELPCDAANQPGRYFFDPDPSLLAAELLGAFALEHDLKSVGAGGAYLTGDARLPQPLLQSFEVQDCMPLRTSAVSAYLAERGVGSVVIKKRGVPIDPNRFHHELKLRGDNRATIVLTRIGKRQVALIVTPLNREPLGDEAGSLPE